MKSKRCDMKINCSTQENKQLTEIVLLSFIANPVCIMFQFLVHRSFGQDVDWVGQHHAKTIVLRHMWTVKAQISLCIRTVWSGPSLSTNTIIGYYRLYEWSPKSWMVLCTFAGWSESVHFTYVQRHFFAWHVPVTVNTFCALLMPLWVGL